MGKVGEGRASTILYSKDRDFILKIGMNLHVIFFPTFWKYLV